jgi:hypothetical protein
MPHQLTQEDARESLTAHVAARGLAIREKYGPAIGWAELQRILADRECVRYPCELAFDATPLQPGELAFPLPLGDRPEDGFQLCIHPYFAADPARVPGLALYQLVAINYGAFASPDDAESFGAAVLGLAREEYYSALCALADEIAVGDLPEPAQPAGCQCGGQGHGCGGASAEAAKSCAHLDKECAEEPAHLCDYNPKPGSTAPSTPSLPSYLPP